MKLPRILCLLLACAAPCAQAQNFNAALESDDVTVTTPVTVTQPGTYDIVWTLTGRTTDSDGTSQIRGIINGATVATLSSNDNEADVSTSGNTSVVLSGTTSSIQISSIDNTGNPVGRFQTTWIFRSGGSGGGDVTQTQLNNLRDELLDAINAGDQQAVQNLVQQLIAVQNFLQDQIDGLEARVTALEQSQENQDGVIASHEAHITALENQVASLTSSLQDALNRLTALESAGGFDPSTLQAQIDALRIQLDSQEGASDRVTKIIRQSKGLGTSDYFIIGGSAAGAAALGIGIYALTEEDEEPAPTTRETHPGYDE